MSVHALIRVNDRLVPGARSLQLRRDLTERFARVPARVYGDPLRVEAYRISTAPHAFAKDVLYVRQACLRAGVASFLVINGKGQVRHINARTGFVSNFGILTPVTSTDGLGSYLVLGNRILAPKARG